MTIDSALSAARMSADWSPGSIWDVRTYTPGLAKECFRATSCDSPDASAGRLLSECFCRSMNHVTRQAFVPLAEKLRTSAVAETDWLMPTTVRFVRTRVTARLAACSWFGLNSITCKVVGTGD